MVSGSSNSGHRGRRATGGSRGALPALADDPILETLDDVPPEAPKPSETPHDKARRAIIDAGGQWVVLHTRTTLSEADARRLARSYQHAKPARLVTSASGRFLARPFQREQAWLVAVAYQPATTSRPTVSARP